MSEIQRYDLNDFDRMEKSDNGVWIHFEDYEPLIAEKDAEIARLKRFVVAIAALAEKVDDE